MLKPRPLPPVHKNQLFPSVHSLGFSKNDDHQTPTFLRNHQITKKKLNPNLGSPRVFAPSTHLAENQRQSLTDNVTPSSSMTSFVHVIRGRASVSGDGVSAVEALNAEEETPRKTVSGNEEEDNVASFLTGDPSSSPRSYQSSSSSSWSSFSPRVLACSKYRVIGEPRFRKRRKKKGEWSLPQMGNIPDLSSSSDTAASPHRHPRAKVNSLDLKSIYGRDSKVRQVPAETEMEKEKSVVLPPLEVGGRRAEVRAGVDAHCLAEKRLVQQGQGQGHQEVYTRLLPDQAPLPAAYKPYFRFRHRQHRFVRSLFTREDVWENSPRPVRCARCVHQSNATLHYCDVLGKRFCRFCSEMTDRHFSRAYENNRLLVPSPLRSPTLLLMKEPSFIGVRKVIITKTAIR